MTDETDAPEQRAVDVADWYRHPDGSIEVVIHIEEHILTAREYPHAPVFREAVEDADYQGKHRGMALLAKLGGLDEPLEEVE